MQRRSRSASGFSSVPPGLPASGRRSAPRRGAFGLIFVLIGLAILTGWDRTVEAALVAASPEWLTRLTTQF